MSNIWDKNVPVEKSSYLCDNEITYFNLDNFRHDVNKLTMIDLFSGAGGFAVGCSWAGFESVLGIDHFEPAMRTWSYNHPNSIGCLGDITKINPKAIKHLLEDKGVNKINLITGGVPCQGFSIANRKHNDNDERNFLFLEYMKFVKEFDPDYIILENVSGMRSTAGGRFEKEITNYMNLLGYNTTVNLLNAADYGVPQIRQRLIFVGVRQGRGLTSKYVFPVGKFKNQYRTVYDAISDLPELGNHEKMIVYTKSARNKYQQLMRGIGEIETIPYPKKLSNHISPNHPQETINMIASTEQGKPMYSKFKQRIRLRENAPSPTQLAGGIRPQFQFGHPTQPRGLTIRERARIQSFPDSYVFLGGIVQERVQTGNAVPPLLVYNIVLPIAEDIRKMEEKIMYRVWYSTESFADYIIDHTLLSRQTKIIKNKIYESDANNPTRFHTMPDHIRKILYLDAPDLIVEKDNEPVFSIEVTTEAGTGHNAFQRFARIAAAVENSVPTFYIYPEGKLISRTDKKSGDIKTKWDEINPLIFRALEGVMSVYNIPARLYYFPSDDIDTYRNNPESSPHFIDKGLCFDLDIVKYPGCPDSNSNSMHYMVDAINEIIDETEKFGVIPARSRLLGNIVIRNKRNDMQNQFVTKANGKVIEQMSPLSAVKIIPTEFLINYLSKYETDGYVLGELLKSRKKTVLYQVNAGFRGDPYPGCLAAIDYLSCRQGLTFEDRRNNLVMVWGRIDLDEVNKTIIIHNEKNSTIEDFFKDVKSCSRNNLLVKNYVDLDNKEIPRYFMQVRYGSTYSKVKHIRVYSYFADAILFPDGSLWRDA